MKLTRRRVTAGLAGLALAGGLAIGGAVVAGAATPEPAPVPADAGMYGGENSPIAVVSEYLDLGPAEMREQMQSGTSLADVATAQGKSVAGLEEAMTAAMQTKLDANTTLTDEQKTAVIERAQERVADMVTKVHEPGAGHGPMGQRGEMNQRGEMGPHGQMGQQMGLRGEMGQRRGAGSLLNMPGAAS